MRPTKHACMLNTLLFLSNDDDDYLFQTTKREMKTKERSQQPVKRQVKMHRGRDWRCCRIRRKHDATITQTDCINNRRTVQYRFGNDRPFIVFILMVGVDVQYSTFKCLWAASCRPKWYPLWNIQMFLVVITILVAVISKFDIFNLLFTASYYSSQNTKWRNNQNENALFSQYKQ